MSVPHDSPDIVPFRFSDAEWTKKFDETQQNAQPSSSKSYNVPAATSREYAKLIDHTLLKLDATPEQIDVLCAEAREHEFKSVCVRLNYVERCVKNLEGSDVVVACVVGFHEGTQNTADKINEASDAVDAGAAELDLVINYPQLKARDFDLIYRELCNIRDVAPSPVVLKLIFETSALEPAQIVQAAHLAAAAGFDFIKTSTGFAGRGASEEDIRLMSAAAEYLATKTKGKRMEVKASGGVRTLEAMDEMIKAGATRIGTSSGVSIMKEAKEGKAAAAGDGY